MINIIGRIVAKGYIYDKKGKHNSPISRKAF